MSETPNGAPSGHETGHAFEARLSDMFGQPSREWDEGGVTERILREINPPADRRRRTALAASVIVGLLASAAAAVLVLSPAVNAAADQLGAMPALIWTTGAAILFLLAAAATKLALEE
jgi:hypothetical protein